MIFDLLLQMISHSQELTDRGMTQKRLYSQPWLLQRRSMKLFSTRVEDAAPVPVYTAYLLHDCAGTFDELPFGEAVSGAELQSSSFLDQVNTAMAQLLHPCLYLEANLKAHPNIDLQCILIFLFDSLLCRIYNSALNWLVSYLVGQ